jgi:hypothetical protein
MVRSVFKYGYEASLLDKPMRFGPAFKSPPKHVIAKEKNGNGGRMYEANELQTILEATTVQMRAMVLLGVNCGFGNHDVATLRQPHISGEWVRHPRPKTGVDRRCP